MVGAPTHPIRPMHPIPAEETEYQHARAAFQHQPYDFDTVLQAMRCYGNVCDWTALQHHREVLLAGIDRGAYILGETFLSNGGFSPAVLRTCAERHHAHARANAIAAAAGATEPAPPPPPPPPPPTAPLASRPLRLGWLGHSFHSQATTYLLIGVFETLARLPGQVEQRLYDHGPADDSPLRQRLLATGTPLLPVHHLSASALARQVRADGIDVLINLAPPATGRYDVFALRAAPLQCVYLYYPGTSGCTDADCFIVDPVVAPPELAHQFTEPLAYLPRCYQPNDPQRPRPRSVPRAALGLPDDAFLFANFNQSYKITREQFARWMHILRQCPHACLCLLDGSDSLRFHLQSQARLHGVAPERLLLQPALQPQAHFERLAAMDLLLDTHPYGAHTGASDALWSGLPVLTLTGPAFASRVAASLLLHCGLDDLVTHHESDFITRAVALAHQPAALAALRQRLAQPERLPIFDATGYAHDLLALLRQRLHLVSGDTPAADAPPLSANL